ncbi:VOC family protein [Alkalicoccus halolimnae]|uniref:VOC family protein n=1 Tax=Alkalicoccus halolimnae TaxID=1667239 RepID=A0A5C7FCR7_9BACI|nr:VOC family protein [Alkalicoccus halolimnae]TXF82559.1 VOC family protein [Alkalicoccus halolimnae]
MNRINLITLGVKDMKHSLQFYRKLGFRAFVYGTEENPEVVFFDNEGSRLSLYPLENLSDDINKAYPPQKKEGFSGITLAFNGKSENEVNAVMELAESAGAKIEKRPQRLFWGGYGGYFTDPDGYCWEVAYGDMWKFDDNNMLVVD